jgi:hypothetical protein
MIAKLATLLKVPVITTASEPNGPNGPLMPEIHQHAPHAVYVPRKGEVNAWDNADLVERRKADTSILMPWFGDGEERCHRSLEAGTWVNSNLTVTTC